MGDSFRKYWQFTSEISPNGQETMPITVNQTKRKRGGQKIKKDEPDRR